MQTWLLLLPLLNSHGTKYVKDFRNEKKKRSSRLKCPAREFLTLILFFFSLVQQHDECTIDVSGVISSFI